MTPSQIEKEREALQYCIETLERMAAREKEFSALPVSQNGKQFHADNAERAESRAGALRSLLARAESVDAGQRAVAGDQLRPGAMRCAKCKFRLTRINLHASTGNWTPEYPSEDAFRLLCAVETWCFNNAERMSDEQHSLRGQLIVAMCTESGNDKAVALATFNLAAEIGRTM